MAVLICKRSNHSLLLSLSGDATVKSIARIKKALAKIIYEPVDSYRLDLSSIAEMDFTFLQLLIAFQNKLKSLNKELLLLNYSRGNEFNKVSSLCGVEVSKLFNFEEE
ncbi:MAG TPA: STAS domain-containing protein [Spirochaetota bacterium]|nr:STAS domain-containing protein [Spirochaetota bacterium]HOK92467.1 STAS domain-containing protein [Spirochaetota bacterium]HPP94942.1 STAS domain-containing protein [Spirochaetota bacterium]